MAFLNCSDGACAGHYSYPSSILLPAGQIELVRLRGK